MSLTRIHIAAFLLLLGFYNAETTGSGEIKVNDSDDIEHSIIDDADILKTGNENEEEEEEQDNSEEDFPILPPIILLDFDNDTLNDNATADEKSKRTANDALGYGFNQNSLMQRKYNYYFPGGKTGTVVSIEESISPFLPKTIIEKVQPATPKPAPSSFANIRQGLQGNGQSTTASNFQSYSNHQYYDPATKFQPIFGLRMKTKSNADPYQGFFPSSRPPLETYSNVNYRNGALVSTTPRPLVYNPTEPTNYVTPSSQSYTVPSSNRFAYATPNRVAYSPGVFPQRYLGQGSHHPLNIQSYSRPTQTVRPSTPSPLDTANFLASVGVPTRINPHGYVLPDSNIVESSTPAPDNVPVYEESAAPFTNLPRYTIENGIKYENKIFWKYPDGRVTDVPPMTYETYSYPQSALRSKNIDSAPIYESTSTQNTLLAGQGPVQFPLVPETSEHQSPFISAESLSNNLSQQQLYRLSYQNLVSQKQAVPQPSKVGNGFSSTTYPTTYSKPLTTPLPPIRNFNIKPIEKNQKHRYQVSPRPISKYMVNSPNPEYTDISYTTESIPRRTTPINLFTPSANGNSAKKPSVDNKNRDDYSNLQYSDLLNYNPSISQYIKNPASILNVQPTFVQAGNSLIPVIILRVDGIPPIQPKAKPNVNLRALLQQYLIQYANSIEELARPSNYNLGKEQLPKGKTSLTVNSLRELARLAQQENGQDLEGSPTDSYVGKSSYDTSNLNIEKHSSSGKYGERTIMRPKVKSVQIIEHPRITNYKAKH